jgi:T4 RnlA family RNA ligase
MLKTTQFIKEHPLLWETLLTEDPYNLKVKRDEELPALVSLMYDQINSDFTLDIVKECRGLILDIADVYHPIIVCHAFDKFFNYGEAEAATKLIDWSTTRVQEKIDGSIVKLYFYKDHWRLASNSCIQAKNAKLESGYNLEQLFLMAAESTTLDEFAKGFNKEWTIIFELVSPYNQVVIQYDKPQIYYLSTRNAKDEEFINVTLKHLFKTPQSYSLSTLEDCINAADHLNTGKETIENEGFVVVDANFNRIKIKSPDYVAMHHLANGLSRENLIHIIRIGEVKEVLNYFPKYEMIIEEMARDYGSYQRYLIKRNFAARKRWKELNQNRKAFAIEYSKKNFPEVFKLLDMDWKWNEYLKGLTDKQLLKNIDRYKAN